MRSTMRIEIRDFPVPGSLQERAQAWLAAQEAGAAHEPVQARPASTVMLVRDGAGAPEVFMIRRVPTMEFAPNMWVFPGGGVDARDNDASLPWAGPSPQAWADALVARDEAQARELVIAAAREVFEECGVLLAASRSAACCWPALTNRPWWQTCPARSGQPSVRRCSVVSNPSRNC